MGIEIEKAFVNPAAVALVRSTGQGGTEVVFYGGGSHRFAATPDKVHALLFPPPTEVPTAAETPIAKATKSK